MSESVSLRLKVEELCMCVSDMLKFDQRVLS